MPRADGRIDAGESLDTAISARAWNRAQDAADIVLRQHRGGGALDFGGAPYIALPCKATNTLARWGAVQITGVAVNPTGGDTNLRSFEGLPCITGGTPTSASPKFGIAIEPIASGKIGRVAVSGLVQARISVSTADPITAGVQAGTSVLVGGKPGVSIMWIESGTGDKWALVRFAGPSSLRLCKTSAAFSKGSIATLDVYESGTPPNESRTGSETVVDVINKYADLQAGKFCSVAMHENGRWYVVAAECS